MATQRSKREDNARHRGLLRKLSPTTATHTAEKPIPSAQPTVSSRVDGPRINASSLKFVDDSRESIHEARGEWGSCHRQSSMVVKANTCDSLPPQIVVPSNLTTNQNLDHPFSAFAVLPYQAQVIVFDENQNGVVTCEEGEAV